MSRAAIWVATLLVLVGIFASARRFGMARAGTEAARTRDAYARVRVVATTSIVGDAVQAVGGDRLRLEILMGPGVDPHLYKASEGDVTRMTEARVVFYGGLHLEGKMADVFAELAERGAPVVAVGDAIARHRLRRAREFAGSYDPHVWFDVCLWVEAVAEIRDTLVAADPSHAAHYRERAERYTSELRELDAYVRRRIGRIPPDQRVLITAHDAFGYYGHAYGLAVHGVQGLSTSTEAGAADVQRLAELIASRRIPAIFVESSVPPRIIEALRAAVRARGFEVIVGGQLFSDALGDAGGPAGTYVGMVRHNTDTIVSALSAGSTTR